MVPKTCLGILIYLLRLLDKPLCLKTKVSNEVGVKVRMLLRRQHSCFNLYGNNSLIEKHLFTTKNFSLGATQILF